MGASSCLRGAEELAAPFPFLEFSNRSKLGLGRPSTNEMGQDWLSSCVLADSLLALSYPNEVGFSRHLVCGDFNENENAYSDCIKLAAEFVNRRDVHGALQRLEDEEAQSWL